MNYGKSVHITQETIETEAVNHFAPGEPILSLGNIGCMLNCVYCHNWKTSQSKHVEDSHVHHYTPESVVKTALSHGIRVLSWTYNDPVVWHEFVRDTATLARKAGMINLYKSAFFISPEAIEELLPCIDIFSISVKSIDPEYYRKYTSGWLEPVLEGTKQVFRAGKHVEISTLMITGISDNEDTARKVSDWVLKELDATVPVHFVRFHPDYKMRDSSRTPIPNLVRAREIAMEMGVEHVYLGNVYDTPWSGTFCGDCGNTLITRYGLNAKAVGLNAAGGCAKCGRDAHVKLLPERAAPTLTAAQLPSVCDQIKTFDWHGDIRSLHVQVRNDESVSAPVCYRRRVANGETTPWIVLNLAPGESYRFIVAKSLPEEIGPEVAIPHFVSSNLHEVFDRAHFPTVSLEEAVVDSDVSPLPIYPGRQIAFQPSLSGPAVLS